MILSNYWKYLYDYTANNFQWINSANDPNPTTYKNLSGNPITGVSVKGSNNAGTVNVTENYNPRANLFGLVGTGTQEVDVDDYDLTSRLAIATSTNIALSYNSDGYTTLVTVSGLNSSGDDITITEVGIAKALLDKDGNIVDRTLIAKKLLDTPITVADGDVFTVTYDWIER